MKTVSQSSRPTPPLLRATRLLPLISFLLSLVPLPLLAISVGKPTEDTSPEAELKSFTVLDGFEVSLFASEKDGLVKPISMRWDERGRLWVITAKSYPQPQPGEVADDKVLILEDRRHSGHVDKVTVFADGLRMPMGIELAPCATWPAPQSSSPVPGSSAAYIGEGEKLWILRDLDGDDHADVKEVVFSGFGTGDVHQNINSFTWTPDGALMFSQGLHNYSNVTTPWGGRRLYGAGFWMYRPLRAQLTPYPTGFPLNAWGTVYDDAGQPFSVAGAAGMFWTTPLLVSTEHLIEGRALPNQGQIVKQGMSKYCGVDIPRNSHWPTDMHGELVSGGFFENCIYRHKLQQDKANPSGYEAVRQPDLITSSSVAFRPVDVKFGPDGALYISDWYNPIIGHYQASFHHPDRDKTHGRIWRVVKKGSPLVRGIMVPKLKPQADEKPAGDKTKSGKNTDLLNSPTIRIRNGNGTIDVPVVKEFTLNADLNKASIAELLNVLEHGDRWAQYQAQRLLMGRDKEDVLRATWRTKDHIVMPDLPRAEITLRAHNWFEDANESLFRTVRGEGKSSNPDSDATWQFRCDVVRSVGLWQDRLKDPLGLLEKSMADEDPRVRLEAIAACSHIPKPESIAIALRALDKPMDSFLDRTLELAVHALAPQWEPALREGRLILPPKHLAWLLDKKSDGEALARIRATLHDKPGAFDPESSRTLLLMLAKRGGNDDVAAALEAGCKEKGANLLTQLADLVESQGTKGPENAGRLLEALINQRAVESRRCAQGVRLAGLWNMRAFQSKIVDIVQDRDADVQERMSGIFTLGRWQQEGNLLATIAKDKSEPLDVRFRSIEALIHSDASLAAGIALTMTNGQKDAEFMRQIIAPFLMKTGSTKAFVAALNKNPIGKETADLAMRALIAMGRNEPELSAALNKILGRVGVVMAYDAQWVSSLANEATVAGNAKRGDEIWHRPALNCIACHSIGGKGGIIGPQLDAVGRGMPVELLVEAVMWPQRQIKEGYVATTVVMKDGRTFVGYKNQETGGELTIRDMASNALTTLQKAQMRTRTDAGSLMPDGLTASLSREELRDLIAYLASLGKEAK